MRSVMMRPAVTPITGMRFSRAGMRKSSAATGARFTLSRPTGRKRLSRIEERVVDHAPGGNHLLDPAFVEIAQEHHVRAPARRDKAAVAQAEGVRRRKARRAVDRVARAAERDQRADHEIEVALLADVERIPIVGAERHERRRCFRPEPRRAHARSFETDPSRMRIVIPLASFSRASAGARRLVVGADARREIGVQIAAGDERRVPVDMAVLERRELVEHVRVAGDHARIVHHLGQADDLRMVAERERGRRRRAPRRMSRKPSPARRTTG